MKENIIDSDSDLSSEEEEDVVINNQQTNYQEPPKENTCLPQLNTQKIGKEKLTIRFSGKSPKIESNEEKDEVVPEIQKPHHGKSPSLVFNKKDKKSDNKDIEENKIKKPKKMKALIEKTYTISHKLPPPEEIDAFLNECVSTNNLITRMQEICVFNNKNSMLDSFDSLKSLMHSIICQIRDS